MKLKIGTKIALGFSIVLLLLAVTGVSSIISTKSIEKDINTVAIINERVSIEKDIESHFYNTVAGIRGYMAYGTNNFKNDCIKEINLTLELEKELLGIAAEDKKEDARKLIDITETYRSGLINDLMPAIERQSSITDFKAFQAAQEETAEIADILVPITVQLTGILQASVDSNAKIFYQSIDDAKDGVARVIFNSIILFVLAVLIGVALSYFMIRSIRNPIIEMTGGADKYAQGDFTEEIKVKSSDEVGELAQSFNGMARQLRTFIADIAANAQTLAAHSEELAASAEEISATVEEEASMTNEVASMAEKGLENAGLTVDESRKVVEVAKTGGKTVKQTINKINSISESSDKVNESIQNLGELSAKIGNITDVITGIADQTNLLALNAAIEAARAGDQGRGFAVVAEEVRKLAEQSASAAKEISQLIGQIQSGVDVAVQAIGQSSVEVKEGVQLASEAGDALGSIINAINQNIAFVEEITQSATQISEGTQQLSAGSEQIASTIQQIAGATQQLAEIANKVQSSVEQFKV